MKEKFQGVLEMAGAAAHELNQPLQLVAGYTELLSLLENVERDNFQAILGKIKESIKKLAAVTKKLNHITRYESMNYVGETRIIDLDKATAPEPGKDLNSPAGDKQGIQAGLYRRI